MEIVDANVLLYAVNLDAPRHGVAKRWLDAALNGPQTVGFAWIALLAFLRLATQRGLFPQPLSLDDAADVMRAWLARPAAVEVHPTVRHLDVVHRLLSPLGTAANLVNDAHLAALSLEHGAEIVSFDGDFARFQDVRWRSPAGG